MRAHDKYISRSILLLISFVLSEPAQTQSVVYSKGPPNLTNTEKAVLNIESSIVMGRDPEAANMLNFLNRFSQDPEALAALVYAYNAAPARSWDEIYYDFLKIGTAGVAVGATAAGASAVGTPVMGWAVGAAGLSMLGVMPESARLLHDFHAASEDAYRCPDCVRDAMGSRSSNAARLAMLNVSLNATAVVEKVKDNAQLAEAFDKTLGPRLNVSLRSPTLNPASKEYLKKYGGRADFLDTRQVELAKRDPAIRKKVQSEIKTQIDATAANVPAPISDENIATKERRIEYGRELLKSSDELHQWAILANQFGTLLRSEDLKNAGTIAYSVANMIQAAGKYETQEQLATGAALGIATSGLSVIVTLVTMHEAKEAAQAQADMYASLFRILEQISRQLLQVQSSINSLTRVTVDGFEKALSGESLLADLAVLQANDIEDLSNSINENQLEARAEAEQNHKQELNMALVSCLTNRPVTMDKFSKCHATFSGNSDFTRYPYVLNAQQPSRPLARLLRQMFAIASAEPVPREGTLYFSKSSLTDVSDAIAVASEAGADRFSTGTKNVADFRMWEEFSTNYLKLLGKGERIQKALNLPGQDPINTLDNLIDQGRNLESAFSKTFYNPEFYSEWVLKNPKTIGQMAVLERRVYDQLMTKALEIAVRNSKEVAKPCGTQPAIRLQGSSAVTVLTLADRTESFSKIVPDVYHLAEYLHLGRIEYCYAYTPLAGNRASSWLEIHGDFVTNTDKGPISVTVANKRIEENRKELNLSYPQQLVVINWEGSFYLHVPGAAAAGYPYWSRDFLKLSKEVAGQNAVTHDIAGSFEEDARGDKYRRESKDHMQRIVNEGFAKFVSAFQPNYVTGAMPTNTSDLLNYYGVTEGNLHIIFQQYLATMYDLYADFELLLTVSTINKWTGLDQSLCYDGMGNLTIDASFQKSLDLVHDVDFAQSEGNEMNRSADYGKLSSSLANSISGCVPKTRREFAPLKFHRELLEYARDTLERRRALLK